MMLAKENLIEYKLIGQFSSHDQLFGGKLNFSTLTSVNAICKKNNQARVLL
jgi:hypothetical protein